MGAERRVVFDLINVVQALLPQALIRDKRLDALAPAGFADTDKDALTSEGVAKIIADLRHRFDWIICDSPAGIERGATLAMRFADAAVIVINPEVSSVRDPTASSGCSIPRRKGREGPARREAHLITRYDAQRGARRDAHDRGRARISPRRCSASVRKAKRCCARPISAHRSRSATRLVAGARLSRRRPPAWATTPMTIQRPVRLFDKPFGRRA
jgi:hypothetical protein